jgi:hypothetical protein
MTVRLLLIILSFSSYFSYSINYVVENTKFNFIDNHFIINNSNATVEKNQLIYDIYRLEFVVPSPQDIDYKIKNIKWIKTDYVVSDLYKYDLLRIGDTFNYRGCSSVYVDIFPYKIDNNVLYYIESIDIEFNIIENSIQESCRPSHQVFNRDFIIQNKLNPVNSTEIDYLVITNNHLLDIAENLKDIHNDLKISIVSTDSIYNLYEELGSEYAIREYVINQMDMFPSLNYLLILGDETIVPPIYNYNSSDPYPSDDYYSSSDLSSAANPQLSTGRMPVTNINDAFTIINNIDNYINNLYFPIDDSHIWRMSIDLVSDDENYSGSDQDFQHTENSHILYEKIKRNLIPHTFYGVDYEPIQNSDGLLHLDLTNDLINNINNGVAVINYIGHGDYNTLADEKILELERDINLFNISDYKLPIWIVGTCSFGEYDGKDSMAEALLLQEKSSIAVISTTRGIGSTTNITYLKKFYDLINAYVESYADSTDSSRLGDLVRNAKNNSRLENLFHLFGDPALPLPFPKNNMIINNEIPESLLIGSDISLDVGAYNGSINVFGKEQNIIRFYENGDSLVYNTQGQSIYKGNFYQDVCFITPLDASECQDCATAYIQIKDNPYNFYQNILDLDITFNQEEIEDDSIQDFLGPEIEFFTEDYRLLYNSDIIFENSSIIVRLTDESGINLIDGLGHSIRYWFNNEQDQNIIDMHEFNYISSCDSISIGEFSIQSTGLNLGYNDLFVEVWDNFNNKTLSSIELKLENSSFKAYDVYNFPNPFKEKTQFTFKTSSYPSIAKISIFDLSGKRLKVIGNHECISSFCNIGWDGKNESGDKINNGTYIYHLEIKNGNNSFEDLYKITKLK